MHQDSALATCVRRLSQRCAVLQVPQQANWGTYHGADGSGLWQAFPLWLCRSYADFGCFSLPPSISPSPLLLFLITLYCPSPPCLSGPFSHLDERLYLTLLPSPFCSTRPQVGSATLGCRAARTASSATACLRARGPGSRRQTSAKRFIIWTGCSRVSEWHTSMVAGCDAYQPLPPSSVLLLLCVPVTSFVNHLHTAGWKKVIFVEDLDLRS